MVGLGLTGVPQLVGRRTLLSRVLLPARRATDESRPEGRVIEPNELYGLQRMKLMARTNGTDRAEPATADRGIYVLGTDAVLQWSLALLASLRRHEPDIPVIAIPFDRQTARFDRAVARYSANLWKDEEHLRAWDSIGSTFFQRTTPGRICSGSWPPSLGHSRYSSFSIVTSSSVDRSTEHLMHSSNPQQTSDFTTRGSRTSTATSRSVRACSQHKARGWNTGFWTGRRGVITLS